MENNVIEITDRNYLQKMKENFGKKMIILFTNRRGPSLLYQTLALEQKGKFVFFQASSSDDLAQKFGIFSNKTVVFIEDPASYNGRVYSGQNTKAGLVRFL